MPLFSSVPIVTAWVAYTPTFTGFGTPTAVTFYSRRVGDSLEVNGTFTAGNTTAVPAMVTIGYNGTSANVSVDTAKVPINNLVGDAGNSGSSTTYFRLGILAPSSNTSTVAFGLQTSTTPVIFGVNGNAAATTGQQVEMKFTVPIVGWTATS